MDSCFLSIAAFLLKIPKPGPFASPIISLVRKMNMFLCWKSAPEGHIYASTWLNDPCAKCKEHCGVGRATCSIAVRFRICCRLLRMEGLNMFGSVGMAQISKY